MTPEAQVPEWIWRALVGGAVVVIGWFAKRELDRIYGAIKDVREALKPLHTDVAQLRGMAVGTDRRLLVVEEQLRFNGKLREVDQEFLKRWGKET